MGNVQKAFESYVGNSPMRIMNEDTFLLLLRYLRASDYIAIACASKEFMKIFYENNYFWAQLCDSLYINYEARGIDSKIRPHLFPKSASKLLAKVFPDKEFKVSGMKMDKLNIRDKSLVASLNLDFRDALKRYYIYFVQRDLLLAQEDDFLRTTCSVGEVHVKVCVYDGHFPDNIWTRRNLKKHGCVKDYYYIVDFGANVKKLEKVRVTVLNFDGQKAKKQKVPEEIGGRLVVYVKSKNKPLSVLYDDGSRPPLGLRPPDQINPIMAFKDFGQ